MDNTQTNERPSPIIVSNEGGITTLTMNTPARLNGWTQAMMDAIESCMKSSADDDATRVLILTGVDPYFCAGVNLSGAFKLDHPRKMHAAIVQNNEALFNLFLEFPKPILVAVNGPAIGASVTSAALCDGIIASELATFSTPFWALGVTPEGCSSLQFPRLMGERNADRMLGKEGWRPNADEALEAGLVQWVVPHEKLQARAHEIAQEWVSKGVKRQFRGGSNLGELKAVNAHESVELADAFLGKDFLKAQFKFLSSKKKWGPASMFLLMLVLRPIWSRMI